MAKNLFETLNKKMQEPQAQPGMTDQTQQAQSLLRTKLGKAGMGSSAVPAASNIQEQQAVKQAQNQMSQVASAGQIQAEQATQEALGQQAQEAESFRQIEQRQKDLESNFRLSTDELLQEFERGKLKLEDSKDAAKTEQLGFQLRLQDQNYINELKRQGDLNRFKSDQDFRVAAAEQEIADNKALLQMGIDAKAFANMQDAEFSKVLATMDVNQAIQMFKDEQAHAKKMGKWKMLASLVSTGSSMYGQSGSGSGNTGGGQ